jgi:hypothetical protein
MYVCMYVCMYVGMYVCMHACLAFEETILSNCTDLFDRFCAAPQFS